MAYSISNPALLELFNLRGPYELHTRGVLTSNVRLSSAFPEVLRTAPPWGPGMTLVPR